VPVHSEHLPERFALLVILVLGEAVGGAARGVHDASWAPVPVAVGVLAFVAAAGMWWIYFDITATSSARELQEDDDDADYSGEDEDDRGADLRHDLFVYAHLPLTLGVVLAGVGLEELVVHPDESAPSTAGWLVAAGLAVFLVGVALVISGTTWTTRSIWPWPTAALPLVVGAALLPLRGGLLTAVYALGLLLLAVQGTRASRQRGTVLSGAD
jgi:low temperature requirement protein LtrA